MGDLASAARIDHVVCRDCTFEAVRGDASAATRKGAEVHAAAFDHDVDFSRIDGLVTDGGQQELDLAADRVPELCDDLGLSQHVTQHATEIAERADFEYPVNNTARVTAAAAVYLAAMLDNEKRTQEAVAEVAEVNAQSITPCYRKLAEHEGYPIEHARADRESEADAERAVLWDRVQRLVGWFQ